MECSGLAPVTLQQDMKDATNPLGHQNRRSHRPPSLQIPMRLRRFGKRIGLTDVDNHLTAPHYIEQIPGGGLQQLAVPDVGAKRRSLDIERSLLRQQTNI